MILNSETKRRYEYMHGRVEKKGRHLPGVKCVVDTCQYHGEGDFCNAANIEIQPRNAKNTEETDCATFVNKNHGMS